jgi:hypothetical protein
MVSLEEGKTYTVVYLTHDLEIKIADYVAQGGSLRAMTPAERYEDITVLGLKLARYQWVLST